MEKAAYRHQFPAKVFHESIVHEAHRSPKRRRTSSVDRKTADLILVDKQGTVNASVWNELADEVCLIWRSILEARKENKTAASIIS